MDYFHLPNAHSSAPAVCMIMLHNCQTRSRNIGKSHFDRSLHHCISTEERTGLLHHLAIISRKATGDISEGNQNSLESNYLPVTAWHYQASTYYTSEGNIPTMTQYLFFFSHRPFLLICLPFVQSFVPRCPNALVLKHCGPGPYGW